MKYLCTSETLFSTINKLNEGGSSLVVRGVGDIVIPALERQFVPFVRSIENTFFKPTPALTTVEKEVLNTNFQPPETHSLVPYKAPISTTELVHAPPADLQRPELFPSKTRKVLSGDTTKTEIEPYRKPKVKSEIEPYKFKEIKTDPEETRLKLRDEDPKVREEDPKKSRDERGKGRFPFPFGGINTPNRGAGSVNEPASRSDLPLNLRVDSIGSYATRQRM